MENEKLDAMKKEIKEKQVALIKKAVCLTYEKIEDLERQKNELQNQMKVYKHDLFDLKDGRLDRILERQSMDANAKELSVVKITKLPSSENKNSSPWYEDYIFSLGEESCKINNSMTKTHASGSYKLKDGGIRYL